MLMSFVDAVGSIMDGFGLSDVLNAHLLGLGRCCQETNSHKVLGQCDWWSKSYCEILSIWETWRKWVIFCYTWTR